MWLSAESLSGNDGDYVSYIEDWSGRYGSQMASQTTTANKPLFRTNQLNSTYPAIEFDGVNDYLVLANSSQNLFDNANKTIFIVASSKTVGTYDYYLNDAKDTDASRFAGVGKKSTEQFQVGYYGTDTNTKSLVANSSVDGTFQLITVEQNSQNINVRVNGLLENIKADANSASLSGSPSVIIGARYDSGATFTDFLNGKIAEIVTYDISLSLSDIKSIESQLITKYNLSQPTYNCKLDTTDTGWQTASANGGCHLYGASATDRVFSSFQGMMNKTDALATCTNLTEGGFNDWYLPTANAELKQLGTLYTFDDVYHASAYSIDGGTTGRRVWTDSVYTAGSSWTIDIKVGALDEARAHTEIHGVVCVRVP